ncbi:NepR family anti-sigma factor [Nitratireductor basaltis]|nr:NepR family anti-sigma factor [Nitratireductor basaltis]
MKYQSFEKGRKAGADSRDGDPLGANSEIGRKLKQYYDDLVSEDIPDRFASLLSQLEQKEKPQAPEKE